MNKLNSMYQKAVRIQTFVCGLLFSIFSFVYLFVFQRDVLEALHFSLAQGKTHFSPLGSALVLTVTLLLLTWGVNALCSIKGKYRSLAYMPAFFVLMAVSDISKGVYANSGNSTWLWLLPTLLVGFIGIAFGCKKTIRVKLDTEVTMAALLGRNIFFLLIGFLLTLNVGNTDETFHHELQMERLIKEKKFDQALRVGEKSLATSQTLTALRALAMMNTGQLGEKLFTYPQLYGANGLFFPEDSLLTLRYTNDSIYSELGDRPYNGGDRLYYLRNLCYEEKGKFTALHYYLSALLLKKRVEAFADVVKDFYEPEDSLPRHFREAIVLYRSTHSDSLIALPDSSLFEKYSAYKFRQSKLKSSNTAKDLMRREFGDTYWWYHDYQK